MLAGRISFQTDALVIGFFLGPQHITLFGIAAKLVEQAKNCLRSVNTVLTPAFSAWEARGHDEVIRRTFLDGTRWVLWLILPVQVGLLILGRPFLALWMGPSYADLCFPTLVVLAVPMGLAMAESVGGRVLYGVGRLRWFARAMMVEALANLLLSVVLARPLSIEGVALGTALPNVIAALAVSVYVCRALEVPLAAYFRQAFLGPLVLAAALAACWLVAVRWAPPNDWAGLIVTGATGTAGYLAVAALVEVGPGATVAAVLAALRPLAGRTEVGAASPGEGAV
jgi:O-antigen/teichoic acid export membrane protein